MEIQVAGVRTRAPAMAIVEDEAVDDQRALKRRKLTRSSTFVETKTIDFGIYVKSVPEEEPSDSCDAAASLRSGGVPASCFSSTRSMDETGSAARYFLDGNESIPMSDFKSESGDLDSTAKQSPVMNNSRRTVMPAEKMPSEAELEEFFAAAQGGLNKRFKSKYNYDIVNDIPLKGRFEWIPVKPGK